MLPKRVRIRIRNNYNGSGSGKLKINRSERIRLRIRNTAVYTVGTPIKNHAALFYSFLVICLSAWRLVITKIINLSHLTRVDTKWPFQFFAKYDYRFLLNVIIVIIATFFSKAIIPISRLLLSISLD